MNDIVNVQNTATTPSGKQEFLLLFRGEAWYNRLPLSELQRVMTDTQAWFDWLVKEGKVKAGQALAREGTTVSGKTPRMLADGPFAESKEAIGGYLLLEAENLDEATAIAKTCPSLAYGTIDVRPVAEECPLGARVRCLLGAEALQAAHRISS